MMKETSKQNAVGLKYGFRSGLESATARELKDGGVNFSYEEVRIPYHIEKDANYTPDFILLDNGMVIETKGRFVLADRQKHLLIQKQHPDIEIRFVFSNPNARIAKKSKTTYAVWCDKHGFKYAKASIPQEWIEEKRNSKSYNALKKLGAYDDR